MSDANTHVTPDAAAALGSLLQQARAAKGLSVGEVAECLKCSARRVEALEGGHYEGLPEPVFIKGFIHTYARFLGVDAQTVAEYVQQVFPEHVKTVHTAPSVSADDLNFSGAPVKKTIPKWVLGLVVLAVIGGVVYAWQSKSSAENAKQTAAASQEVAAQSSSASNLAASNVKVVPMAASSALAAPASAPATAASTPAPNASTAAGAQTLVVNLKNRSWLRVTDAQGKVLISEVVPAGSSKQFDAGAPYKVVIGYVLGASIQFAGQDVPMPQSKNTTASLTVGGE